MCLSLRFGDFELKRYEMYQRLILSERGEMYVAGVNIKMYKLLELHTQRIQNIVPFVLSDP